MGRHFPRSSGAIGLGSHLVWKKAPSHPRHSRLIHHSLSQAKQHHLDKPPQDHPQHQHNPLPPPPPPPSSKSPVGLVSPARVHKLIASQSDPLLAKEIFDLASKHPGFRHSYASYHALILKLGQSRQFSLMRRLLSRLRSEPYQVCPDLLANVIQIYGDADLPQEALNTFYSVLRPDYNFQPSHRHLNRLLEALVAHRTLLRTALDAFVTAGRYGVNQNTKSYNILMRAFCLNGDLSIAYRLFNEMFKKDIVPDVESYRIMTQGLCRRRQVNGAVDLLEDMLNKGFVPDALTYTTLLNSLCRKTKLKEAYKLLCRMKVKGCNPDIVHYNTVILGFCRKGRALEACKILKDMPENGCLPNLVSYRTLVSGLCDRGMLEEASSYMQEMISKGFSPHFSVLHAVVKGFCSVGKIEEACGILGEMLKHGEAPHIETWLLLIPRICEDDEMVQTRSVMEKVLKVELKRHTRIVEAGVGLEEYVTNKMQSRSKKGWA